MAMDALALVTNNLDGNVQVDHQLRKVLAKSSSPMAHTLKPKELQTWVEKWCNLFVLTTCQLA